MNVTPVPNRDVAGTRVTYAKRRSQAAANIDPTGDRLLPFGRSRGRPFGDMPRAGILWKYGRDRIGPPQNVVRVVANATCRFCRKTLAPDIAAAIRPQVSLERTKLYLVALEQRPADDRCNVRVLHDMTQIANRSSKQTVDRALSR